jgi:integrase
MIEVRTTIDQFLDSKSRRLRPATLESYRTALAKLPSGLLLDVKLDVLELILESASAEPATLNKWAVIWSGFFSWCTKRGLLEHNPASGLERYRVPKPVPKYLTLDEERRLLVAADEVSPALGRLVRAALWSGLRRGTLEKLCPEHVQGAAWAIPAALMKSGRGFQAPILPELLPYIRAAVKNGTLFGRLDNKVWQKATEAAGLDGLHFHDLRRTFLVRCRQAGVPLEVAMKLGDWTSAQVVLTYYRAVSDEEMVQGLDKAFKAGAQPAPEYAI